MNKNTLGPLAVVIVGVAAFGTILAFAEHPTSCACGSSANPWYPCVNSPCPMQSLSITSYQFNTTTNVTLNITNPGNGALTFIAYYVKDSSANQYANSNWSGPTIASGAAISVNILIDGTAFTFVRGYSYTVSIATSRNFQYSFTITD